MFELEGLPGFDHTRKPAVIACYEDFARLDREGGTTVGAVDFICDRDHSFSRSRAWELDFNRLHALSAGNFARVRTRIG